jgi:hypothetical protein
MNKKLIEITPGSLKSWGWTESYVVASPWSSACTNLITWPLKYLDRGENRAVLGGWDPSARKFFKTDELTFSVPYTMFIHILERFKRSFLTTKTWAKDRKKIARSKWTWVESATQ